MKIGIKQTFTLFIIFILLIQNSISVYRKNRIETKSNNLISLVTGILNKVGVNQNDYSKCLPESWKNENSTILLIFDKVFSVFVPIVQKIYNFIGGFMSLVCKVKTYVMKILASIIKAIGNVKEIIFGKTEIITNTENIINDSSTNSISNNPKQTDSISNNSMSTLTSSESLSTTSSSSSSNSTTPISTTFQTVQENSNNSKSQNIIVKEVVKNVKNSLENVKISIEKLESLTNSEENSINKKTSFIQIHTHRISSRRLKIMVKKFWALSNSEVNGIFDLIGNKVQEVLGRIKDFIKGLLENIMNTFNSQFFTDIKKIFNCMSQDNILSESGKTLVKNFKSKIDLFEESKNLGFFGTIIAVADLITAILCQDSFKISVDIMSQGLSVNNSDTKYETFGKSFGEFVKSVANSELTMNSVDELKNTVSEINSRKRKMKK